MSFAAPLWLLAAALVGVVLLLHTVRQTQHVVASLYLWRRLTINQRPRRTLRPPVPNILLILQVLAVLALAIALAHPLFAGSASGGHAILVIDRSASMGIGSEGERRLDHSLGAAQDEIARLARAEGARVSIVETGATTRYVAARQVPGAALSAAVAALTATAAPPDWAATANRLPGLVAPGEMPRIVVYTDDGALAAERIAAVLPDADVTIVSPQADTGQNLGVAAQARPLARENAWEVTGTVTGDLGAEPPALALRYRPLDSTTTLDWASPELEPVAADQGESLTEGVGEGAPMAYGFALDLQLPGPGTIELVLDGDAAPYDDSFTLVLDDPLALIKVLYVGPGNRNLELALLSSGQVDLFSGRTLPGDAGTYDLVIAEDVVLESRPPTNMAWLGSARLDGEPAPSLAQADVTRWSADHPLSRGIDWRLLEEMVTYVFSEPPAGEAILWAGDDPMVLARTLPQGRDVRLAMEIGEDGWVETAVLPALMVNLLGWLDTGIAEPARACTVGARCAIPARHAGAPIADASGTAVRPALAVSTDGALLDSANGFSPDRPGIYTVGTGADRFQLAVNASPSVVGMPFAEPVTGEAPDPAGILESLPLWVWFALAAALLLALEAGLALRRREGFARTAALASDSVAARRKRWALGLRTAAIVLVVLAVFMPPFPTLVSSRHDVLVAAPGITALDENLAAACGGILPASLGQVSLGTPPRIVREAGCTRLGGDTVPNSDEGAAAALALELAAAMIPADTEGRIVLAAQGGVTASPLEGTETVFAGRALGFDVLTLPQPETPDAWAAALDVPNSLRAGDTAPVTAIVGSAAGGETEIVFGMGEREISRAVFPLEAGANRIDARVPDLEEGEALFWVEIGGVSEGDVSANDRIETVREIAARPRVAIVSSQPEWGAYLADAMAVQGMDGLVVAPNRAPFWLHDWLADYDGVALMNVPAIDLDTRQQEQLDEFVSVHGRGLMILGGENTFGPGGYFQTPLEAMSPLSSQVPQEAPVAALAFVLDRSGSMQAVVDGVSRLDIAKQATLSAVGLLNPESQVSVIVFDEFASVIVPMQERKDEAEIESALANLDPGGGTSIAPGLEEALVQMEAADAPVRHIIVMSDGLTQPGDFDALMTQASAMDVTVSTVAIGNGADVGRLAELARSGGGSSHATGDFRALPSILSQEAMMLGGEPMEYGDFPIQWLDRSPVFLDGLPQLPPLEGYVLTSVKPQADLHLATTDAEGEQVPVLASWQYGNGSVLALATHAVGPGSLSWQELPQFPQIYGQAMRQFLADAPDPGLALTTRRAGDALIIEGEALDREGQPLLGLLPRAEIVDGAGTLVADLVLQPDAAGVYVGRTPSLAPGHYTISADAGFAPETETPLVTQTTAVLSYPAALDPFRASAGGLVALVAQTGGEVRAEVPQWGGGWPGLALAPAWRPLLVIGLALFLLDLALRYAPGLFAWRAGRGRSSAATAPGRSAAADPLPRAA